MSLRSEIHAAIDEVAPPAPMLERQVQAFVLADDDRSGFSRRGRIHWTRPVRGAVAVLAAVLVVALMAGLVMGGRLWREWTAAPANHPYTINMVDLDRLRARALALPTVQPGAVCPVGPIRSFTDFQALGMSPVMFGAGPIYSAGNGERYVTQWGTYIQTGYRVDPGFAELVLIRARDLRTGQPVVFSNTNFSGTANVSDRVVGTDFVLDQTVEHHPDLVIDMTQLPPPPVAGYWPAWGTLQAFPAGASGCIGFQADGAGFSEVFVVSY
jgi:hypothetical protein